MPSFFSKDNTPPAPEKRVIPKFATIITNPAEAWITTQVFIDKKDKKKRLYFAATSASLDDEDGWRVYKISYSCADACNACSSDRWDEQDEAGEAIQVIAEFEKSMLRDGFLPVPHLRGNYREAANLNGAYFDDKGNYIAIAKDKPLAKDAAFSRKGIQALYSKAAEKPAAEPFIKAWDDFHREIVRKYPPEALTRAELPDWFVKNGWEMMEKTRALIPIVKDPQATLYDKSLARNRAYCCGVKIDGSPEAQYAYHVTQLTALMRAGSEIFRQLSESVSAMEDNMFLLKEIGETVRHFVTGFHRKDFGFTAAQAEQLVNIMMTGPDPYADKPLPLEEILSRYAPSQKPEPKQPSL